MVAEAFLTDGVAAAHPAEHRSAVDVRGLQPLAEHVLTPLAVGLGGLIIFGPFVASMRAEAAFEARSANRLRAIKDLAATVTEIERLATTFGLDPAGLKRYELHVAESQQTVTMFRAAQRIKHWPTVPRPHHARTPSEPTGWAK
ncbi:MAG: hypothetical protein ACLP0J_26090 [Solirubrobacteraceae bacterium]